MPGEQQEGGRFGVASSPTVEEAADLLKRLIDGSSMVVAAGFCSSQYEGRGASVSTEGDKLLIVKPGGAVILHGPRGFRPLNWQPNTSHTEVSVEKGTLTMKFYRRTPREVLTITCSRVWYIAWVRFPEEGAFWMYMTEDDLRRAVASNPRELLGEDIRFFAEEKRTPTGKADLYGVDGEGNIVIVEIKRVKADESAVRQLEGYVRDYPTQARVRGILVAPDISDTARSLLESLGLEFRRVDLKKAYSLMKSGRGSRRSVLDFL
ncbi:endonuclease NucS [Aeropyrum camini]|uniref:Endonuclease NucS n=1 Tax=Aeropyrum camini SY1 = JCM 12091 TaxID=1198449 RepID=U3TCD9_9CREN|nr:endonuclease NucS [Aeropyrum camini]BAN90096.1 predicted nuclease of the RecB family [Aeropyrum camini SY1 = JCM 12091]